MNQKAVTVSIVGGLIVCFGVGMYVGRLSGVSLPEHTGLGAPTAELSSTTPRCIRHQVATHPSQNIHKCFANCACGCGSAPDHRG